MTQSPAADPTFPAFAEAWGQGRAQLVIRRLIDDLETPVSAYLKLGAGAPYAFLFESVEGGDWRGRYSILTLAPDLVWRCRGDKAEVARGDQLDRFTPEPLPALASMKALVDACRFDMPDGAPPMAAGVFGVFGYDLVRLSEPLGAPNPDPLDLPDAVLTRPSIVAVFDGVAQEIVLCTVVWPDAQGTSAQVDWDAAQARLDQVAADLTRPTPRPAPSAPSSITFTGSSDPAAYAETVARAKAYIAAGDIFQVVPSQRFTAAFPRDPFTVYRALRRTNPSPFLFHMDFGDFHLTGSSPEILVRLRGGELTIRPIAGTRPRGATPEADRALEADLLADPKERSEHLMLLDLGRNDVGRVAQPGSVKVTDSFFVERYSHVMHLVSNVTGRARDDVHPVDVLLSALPAGTLSGAPKVRAMEIIDELETVKRGVGYAGAAGYISSAGEIDACIVLRTALFKDGVMYVQAGGGVVVDSDPQAEYEETLHKSRALKAAAEEAWRFG
jgi:anthranilate synthase component 1